MVSSNKLVKRLRRELTANPKKAVALGGLLLVALYFWAPLIGGWFTPAAVPTVPASEPSVAAVASPGTVNLAAAGPPSGEKPATPSPPWQQLVQWRAEDPRTQPAARLNLGRDPFQAGKSRAEKLAAAAKEQEKVSTLPAPRVWKPQELGLQLTSTIVGGKRSVALISGKAYSQGQTIELAKDGKPLALTVAEIHVDRIVLTWMDQRIELALPEREGQGRMEMVKNP